MTRIPVFDIERRSGPLLISIPHVGTAIPDDLREVYTPEALCLADTDWHLDRLYDFAARLNATVIRARYSRYVIDLNRPATGESLYPGMITTTLCATETFRGEPVYKEGREPDQEEIDRRVARYWRPFHGALQEEIARLRESSPEVLLWEAHSIASVLPRLFSGKLPDLNFGTSDGQSCGDSVIAAAVDSVRASDLSWVLNGRFKGGFITRKYGDPTNGVHAIQLEMCQSIYMEEVAPFDWRSDLASEVAPLVEASMKRALAQLRTLPPTGTRGTANILPG